MPGYEGYDLWHNENGSITFQCTPTLPGTYKISVEHDGTPLNGLPVCCVVQVAGEGYVTAYKAGQEADLDIDVPEPEVAEFIQGAKQDGQEESHDEAHELEQAYVEENDEKHQIEELHHLEEQQHHIDEQQEHVEGQQQYMEEQQHIDEQQQHVEGQQQYMEEQQHVEAEQDMQGVLHVAEEQQGEGEEVQEAEGQQTETQYIFTNEIPKAEETDEMEGRIVETQQQELHDQLGGAVAMEITDAELADEIVDIKPIVDLGIGLPGGAKFVLEKAPADPNNPEMSSPIYILKEQEPEMTMLLEQTEGQLESGHPVVTTAADAASVVQSIFTEPVDGLSPHPGGSEYSQVELAPADTEYLPDTPRRSRRIKKPYSVVATDISKIPTEVLNPPKVDTPILIGPGQNTKSTFLRRMTRGQRRETSSDEMLNSPRITRTTVHNTSVTQTITSDQEPVSTLTSEQERTMEAAEELNNLFQSFEGTSAQKDNAEETKTNEETAVTVKQEPSVEPGNVGTNLMETDDENPSASDAEVMSPSRRVSERTKKVFRCRKMDCGKTFSNRKELDEHNLVHDGSPFICPDLKCKKIFMTRKNYRNHRKIAHKEEVVKETGKIPCIFKECKGLFTSQADLKTHIDLEHTAKEKRFMCEVCFRLCGNRITLKQHQETHVQSNFKCKEEGCELHFKTQKMFDAHTEKHANGLWCTPCGKSFHEPSQFEKHTKRIHSVKTECEYDEDGRAVCPECGKAVSTKTVLAKHIENVHGNKRFSCPICNSVCKTKENLQRHAKTHDDVKRFMCDTCGDFFKTKDILRCHVAGMHNMEQRWEITPGSDVPVLVERPARPFVCKYCDRTFKRKAVLKEHLAIHESMDDIPCTVPDCHKTFPTVTLMKTHIRSVHKPGRRVPCLHEGCGKFFKTPSALQVHMNGTHLNLRFQCIADGCQHSFTTKHHMLSHFQLKHTALDYNYACSICDKRFRLKEQVKAHLDVHKQERPYSCDQCSKTFTTRSRLTAHVKIHVNNSEHVCFHCGKSFIRKYRLKEHLAKHEHAEVAVAYTVV